MTVGAWKAVGAAVAAAVVGAGSMVAKGMHQGAALEAKVDQAITDLAQIKSDVRLLKCIAGFPGDCPGQAPHGP